MQCNDDESMNKVQRARRLLATLLGRLRCLRLFRATELSTETQLAQVRRRRDLTNLLRTVLPLLPKLAVGFGWCSHEARLESS